MKRLLSILPRTFRRRGLWTVCTLFVRAALNFVGLAVLLPVLALVLDPASLEGPGPLGRIYRAAGFSSTKGFALAVCGGVVAFIVVKCGLNLWLARVERRYIYDLYRALSRRLFVAYHQRGFAFVKSTNSAVLARNVNGVCLSFAAGVLRPAATIAVETALFVMMFGAMALYAPLAALLAVAVFLPAAWLYYGLVRNRLDRYGAEENSAQREKARLVAETFRGFADIEINDAFPKMLRAFDRALDEVVRTRLRQAAIGQLPQALTEVGLALGMAALVAWSVAAGPGRVQILFGVFAVAALRLMPSVRNVLTCWTTIKYNRYTLDILSDIAAETTETAETAESLAGAEASADAREVLPFEHQIAVRDLRFRFEDGGRELFDGLSLTIRKGERVGIRGVSGAGKTTLFNLLLGLYTPTAGRIEIDGVPLTPMNRPAWHNRIGYVSQNLFLTDDTFAANVALGEAASQIDRKRVEQALEAARLGEVIASLPQGVDTRVGECGCRLSGGQRQRIGIARALYRRADVLFFDEATSSLDHLTEEDINRSLADIARETPRLTILMIAHRESSLACCDRIITLVRQP